ncbi:MAG: hypothetical protein EPO26_15315 [Chloroflexota bacterium]|nr:MAG: hypothetical protein EPO26_15315 [Chloroflexota bacterium]
MKPRVLVTDSPGAHRLERYNCVVVTILDVPAIAAGEIVPAGCCPLPAAAAAVQILMFVDGVTDVEVDERLGHLWVTHDQARIADDDLAAELTAVGLSARVVR